LISDTLTLYLLAGGFSFSLGLVLLVFAYLQGGTRVLGSFAVATVLLSIGFVISGFGPQLSRGITVLGTNVLLLSAGPVLYSGFVAYIRQQPWQWDRVGWLLVLGGVPLFWYWGLQDPDGRMRSVVFSCIAAATHVRTALALAQHARHTQPRSLPLLLITLLFGVIALWMAGRGLALYGSEPAPAAARGANPTTWVTVFAYIVLLATVTACVLWLERAHPSQRKPARSRLHLLWAMVAVLLLAITSASAVVSTPSAALKSSACYNWRV
jgi:hypothetical protein